RKAYLAELSTVPLLIIDDLGMRKLTHTAAEDLLELIMRRYERASTLLTSNRPVDDWGKLLGDTAAVTALLDRLLHHAHVLKCGPRSWRTNRQTDLQLEAASKQNSPASVVVAGLAVSISGRFSAVRRGNEMWHIDTTVIRLLDGTRAYLHAVIDNYSRRILAWRVADTFAPVNSVSVLLEASRAAAPSDTTPVVLADAGAENVNAQVDNLITAG